MLATLHGNRPNYTRLIVSSYEVHYDCLTFCKSSLKPPILDLPVNEYAAADCFPTTLAPAKEGKVYELGAGVMLFWLYLVRDPKE